MELTHKAELLEQMQLYTSNLENFYEETRKFRHDQLNILSSIYGYIENNDITGIKEYFIKYISPFTNKIPIADVSLDMFKNIKIPELKGILSMKLIYAQTLGIQLHIEVFDEVTKLCFDLVDLCRASGILLDNAIDACNGTENSRINFAIIKREIDFRFIFSNTITEIPPLTEIFKKGYSSKSNNRGFGLFILQQIIDRNKFSSIQTELSNGWFTIFIDIAYE